MPQVQILVNTKYTLYIKIHDVVAKDNFKTIDKVLQDSCLTKVETLEFFN